MTLAVVDYTGIGILVAACGTSIAAVIAAIASAVAAHRAGTIEREVRTMNELSLGQLGEAEETRRVQAIRPGDRTARESRHLDRP